MLITSRSNPSIIEAASLKEKKYRDRNRCFLLEGIKLFHEAVSSGTEIVRVFTTSDNLGLCLEGVSSDLVTEVSDGVFEKISTEKSPQGIICIVKYIDKIHFYNKIYSKEEIGNQKRRLLLLSSIRDPGNMGTIIRTAAAFDTDELILSPDCADIYNPRTVRASMGALLRQRISVCENLAGTVKTLREAGYELFSAVLDSKAVSLTDMEIKPETVFIIGNEGHGLDPGVIEASNGTVYIPMSDNVESLNASVAASVFLWHTRVKRTI